MKDPSRSLDHSPSSPSRHENWKREHQRKDGEFTSETTHKVTEKIVSK